MIEINHGRAEKVKGAKRPTFTAAPPTGYGLDLIAAKVYRPRMFRNLRNDGGTAEPGIFDEDGKTVHDQRLLHACERHPVGKKCCTPPGWNTNNTMQ